MPDSCVVNIATQLSFHFIVQLCVLYVSIFVSICFEWLPPWPDLPYKGEKYTYIFFFLKLWSFEHWLLESMVVSEYLDKKKQDYGKVVAEPTQYRWHINTV